jgi:hypothetical protein
MRTRRSCSDPIARSAFAGFCFPPDVIVLAVRWYLRFALPYRDVEESLTQRGIRVDHVTIYRWVQRFTSLCAWCAPLSCSARQATRRPTRPQLRPSGGDRHSA